MEYNFGFRVSSNKTWQILIRKVTRALDYKAKTAYAHSARGYLYTPEALNLLLYDVSREAWMRGNDKQHQDINPFGLNPISPMPYKA